MRRVLILLSVALGVAGCGAHAVTTIPNLPTQAAPLSPPPPVAPIASSAPAATPNAPGQTVWAYTMAASNAPTHCSVWLQGHYAEIFFSATSVDVSPACAFWVQNSAASGELWIADEMATYPYEQIKCLLQDGNALARVEDEAAGSYGEQACNRLVSDGWTAQTPTGS